MYGYTKHTDLVLDSELETMALCGHGEKTMPANWVQIIKSIVHPQFKYLEDLLLGIRFLLVAILHLVYRKTARYTHGEKTDMAN